MTGIIESIAKSLSETRTAVEINTAGPEKPVAEIYPSDDIIGILFRNNAGVTIGSDSHASGHVCYGYPLAIEKGRIEEGPGFYLSKKHELNL